MAELHQIFVHVACACGLVLVCNTLCISGFLDDVIFSYHGSLARIKHDVMFGRIRQVAVPVARQTTTVSGQVHHNATSMAKFAVYDY